MEQLYLNPISQPARAIAWLCQLNNHKYQYTNVNLAKGESRSAEFKKTVNPMGKVPVLRDGDFVLSESHAIMVYLADKHGWDQWYPKDLKTRARINEYLNWHHHNARLSSTEIFANHLLTNMGRGSPEIEASKKKEAKTVDSILRMLEFWLSKGNKFLATPSHPSLADMSCYNEVVQLEVMGLTKHAEAKYPHVAAWLKRMKTIPHHDEQIAPMIKFFNKFKMSKL